MAGAIMDINSDLGELSESLANGADLELMRYISSANIACGGHAGNAETMLQMVATAARLNVAVGVHPSYPDRANFGRVEMLLKAHEVEAVVRDQIMALKLVADTLAVPLVHVKPHGALYHAANRNSEIARAIGRAVASIDPKLVVVGQAGHTGLEVWRGMGLRCAAEAFADRAYEPDGTLRPRTLPGALLEDPERAARQALDLAVRHMVVAADGSEVNVAAQTLCIHSDTPGAVAIARAVRQRLQEAGVEVRPL